MKTTLSVYDFRDAFIRANRKEQFSYDALGLIYDWLENNDPDYDLDVICLCCELSEDYCDDIAANYSIDISECIDEVTTVETVMNYLQDETTVIGTTESGTIVYVQF
jgi:hypothetical protein